MLMNYIFNLILLFYFNTKSCACTYRFLVKQLLLKQNEQNMACLSREARKDHEACRLQTR